MSASTVAAGAGQVTVTASEAGRELFTLASSLAAQLDDLALTGGAADTANDAAALAAVQAAFLGHGVTLSNATQIAVLDTVQSLDGTGNIVLNTTTRWLARDPGGQTFVLVRDGSLLRVLRPALVSADAGGIGVAINIRGSGAGSVAIGAAVGLNEVTNTVRAAIEGSTVSATAGVTVSAISGVTIDVLTIGIALGIAGGQTGGISLAGAGSGSGNTIGSSATATISGGSVTTTGPVAVSAADSSRIRADAGAAAVSVAGGGTGGGALAVGGSLAVSTISTTARASLDGTTLGSSAARVGAVTVSASSSALIDSLAVAGSLAGSGGGTGGISVGLAGAGSENTITNVTEALVRGASTVFAASLTVAASDSSTIDADAGSGSLALAFGGSGGIAFAGTSSWAVNLIANTVRAAIQGSTVDTTGSVTVSASESGSIDAFALGLTGAGSGGSVGGISLAGSGSEAQNGIGNTVEAVINPSTIRPGGTVNVTATDASSIDATAGGLAISIAGGSAGGIGLAKADSSSKNQIGEVTVAGTTRSHVTRAVIDGSTVGTVGAGAGKVTVAASTTSAIRALSVAGGAAVGAGGGGGVGLFGAGAATENRIDGTTEALIRNGSTVRTRAGADVEVRATNSAAITAQSGALALSIGGGAAGGGALSIGAAFATNTIGLIGNAVIASISGSTVASGRAVLLTASASSSISAMTIGFGGALSGGTYVGISISDAGSHSTNQVATVVEAKIVAGSVVTSGGTGDVLLTATDSSFVGAAAGALAAAFAGGAFSVGIAIGVSRAAGSITMTTRALISDATVEAADRVELKAESTAEITVFALAGVVSVSATFAAGDGEVTTLSAIDTTVEALIENSDAAQGQHVRAPNGVSLTATSDAVIETDAIGIAVVVAPLAFADGTVSTDNVVTSSVRAGIGNSEVTSAAGSITVLAESSGSIVSSPSGLPDNINITVAGISLGIASTEAHNTVTPATSAFVSGSSVTAGLGVSVSARDTTSVDSDISMVNVALAAVSVTAGGMTADSHAGGTVTASLTGSQVTANGGDVDVLASSTPTVDASLFTVNVNISVGVAITLLSADVTIDPNVTASIDGGTVSAPGRTIDVDASFTGSTSPSVDGGGGSLLGGVGLLDANATIGGMTRAFVRGTTTLTAATLDVDATDSSTATPSADTFNIGLVGVSDIDANPNVERTTEAFLGGTLTGGSTAFDVRATSTSRAPSRRARSRVPPASPSARSTSPPRSTRPRGRASSTARTSPRRG